MPDTCLPKLSSQLALPTFSRSVRSADRPEGPADQGHQRPKTRKVNPDCPLPELLTWAETWLPTLAPEVPVVYILDQTLPSKYNATTGRDMDLAYRSEIGTRWRGRGACILIDLDKYRLDEKRLREVSHADDATIAAMEGYVRGNVLKVLAHELAHAVDWSPLVPTPRYTRTAIDNAIWKPTTALDPRLPAPWDDHGGDFVRTALHISYRAKRQGVVLPPFGLAAGFIYDMATIYAYHKALGNEPWRLRNASFKTIRSTRPPKRFSELWHHDIANWLRRCASQGPLTDEIISTGFLAANALPGCGITKEKLVAVVAA